MPLEPVRTVPRASATEIEGRIGKVALAVADDSEFGVLAAADGSASAMAVLGAAEMLELAAALAEAAGRSAEFKVRRGWRAWAATAPMPLQL